MLTKMQQQPKKHSAERIPRVDVTKMHLDALFSLQRQIEGEIRRRVQGDRDNERPPTQPRGEYHPRGRGGATRGEYHPRGASSQSRGTSRGRGTVQQPRIVTEKQIAKTLKEAENYSFIKERTENRAKRFGHQISVPNKDLPKLQGKLDQKLKSPLDGSTKLEHPTLQDYADSYRPKEEEEHTTLYVKGIYGKDDQEIKETLTNLFQPHTQVLEVIPIRTEDGDPTGTAYAIVEAIEKVLETTFQGIKVV